MERIFIRHIVGRCPVCQAPVLDSGQDDDPANWEHATTGPSTTSMTGLR